MKNILLFLICLFIHIHLSAQQKNETIPLHIGYYGAYGIQPGIKVGSVFNLKAWEIEKGDKTKSRHLFISPQIGVFTRPRNHTSLILNTDLGYRITSGTRNFYLSPSLGFGYLMSNQVLSQTIDLGSGETIGKDKEIRNYFLPTANIEFGGQPKNTIGWYSKFSYGRKISSAIEDSTFFALELGIILAIKQKEKQ